MPAGRRPKPTVLKLAQGNPGKRKLPTNEPKPASGVPKCPAHLDKGAKAEWKRVSAELTKIDLLTSLDRAALAAYCAAYSRWANAEEQIQKFGAVIKSPKSGFPIQNPYVGISNTALQIMHRFQVEFGLTPSSRARLSVGAPAEMTDPFADFMASAAINSGPVRDIESSKLH